MAGEAGTAGDPIAAAGRDPIAGAGTVMGAEILGRDWSATALGPLASWPVSLRSTLSLMLACPTPMFLAWGPDLRCFYNDAYRPMLGFRTDTALGAPFKTVWSNIWDELLPLVEATLAGQGCAMRDMKLDLMRGGVSEESFWSFSYSPVYDDAGRIAGLLNVTAETTAKVVAERERVAADARLEMALSVGTGIGAWDWDVLADRVKADARFARLYGVDPDKAAKGAPIAAFFTGIHPEDLPGAQTAILAAMQPGGGTFTHEYRLLDADGRVRWVAAQGRCLHDAEGRPVRFPGVSFEITERKQAELQLKAAKDERDFVIALTARQRELTDPETMLRLSAERVAQRLGLNRAGFYRRAEGDRMTYMACWTDGGLPDLAGEQPADLFGALAATERTRGQALVFGDSRADRAGGLRGYADKGVLAGFDRPIVREGSWQAGFYVHHGEPHAWSAGEVELVREVADLTWLAVQRVEALLRLEGHVALQSDQLAQASIELRNQVEGRTVAESQVRQLQKMEAIGQLTGGIAHDFNNMLAVIIGGLNLMQRRLARGDTNVARYVDGAMESATRAAALTQRLLAFSRQQPLAPEAIDGNRMVAGLTDLLSRTLGERVELETVLSAGLWKAKADPNQLENVILNLAVNARDAMPDGGKLTIETANAHVDTDYGRENEIAAGQYVMIAVTDTGTGMAADVLAKAFEPFFTTKGIGKGTGLGLSQVFGFARQSGGHVRAYSEVGHGTTFKLYLPRFYGDAVPVVSRRVAGPVLGGSHTEIVLVVEDEDRVRTFSVESLRELGYTVVHAASGAEALAMIEAGQDVTLLFTDIVMPGMTGRQLAERAMPLRPAMKVLYTTGYTRNAVVHNGVLDPGTNYLPKPFGIDALAVAVRSVLDA